MFEVSETICQVFTVELNHVNSCTLACKHDPLQIQMIHTK